MHTLLAPYAGAELLGHPRAEREDAEHTLYGVAPVVLDDDPSGDELVPACADGAVVYEELVMGEVLAEVLEGVLELVHPVLDTILELRLAIQVDLLHHGVVCHLLHGLSP